MLEERRQRIITTLNKFKVKTETEIEENREEWNSCDKKIRNKEKYWTTREGRTNQKEIRNLERIKEEKEKEYQAHLKEVEKKQKYLMTHEYALKLDKITEEVTFDEKTDSRDHWIK